MSGSGPDRAMVLAAGLGERMRPLTDTTPKPLIEIAGRSMLDRVLDRLADAGIETAVVNTHWLAEQIEDQLAARAQPEIVISREETRLETGGGVANALTNFGGEAFFVVNADIIWRNGTVPALERLCRAWRDEAMDALLLVTPVVHATGYDGSGDFLMDPLGRLSRRAEREIAPFVFTGVQIVHPRLFDGAPDGAFSMNTLYDRAVEDERLFGIAHDGDWYHIGTPDAIGEAEAEILEREGSRVRRLF